MTTHTTPWHNLVTRTLLVTLGTTLAGCAGAAPATLTEERTSGARVVAPAEAEREAAPDPVEAWLATLTLRVERPTRFLAPADAVVRTSATVTTYTSSDGRSVLERYSDGALVEARLAGPPHPEGAQLRLIPVLHSGVWPHFALLIAGSERAVPFSGDEALDLALPLRRAASGDAAGVDGPLHAEDLDATVRLRHFSCAGLLARVPGELEAQAASGDEDASDDGAWDAEAFDQEDPTCFFYGSEAALAAVSPDPGGWRVVMLASPPRRPGLRLDPREPLDEEGGRLFVRVQQDDPEPSEDGEFTPPLARVELQVGRRFVTVADVIDDPREVGVASALIEAEGELLVVIRLIETGVLYVARHHPRTGRSLGPVFRASAETDGEPHGMAYIGMLPVRVPSGMGVALAFGQDDLLLFEAEATSGRWVRVADPQGDDDPEREDDAGGDFAGWPLQLVALDTCDDVPCLRRSAPRDPV